MKKYSVGDTKNVEAISSKSKKKGIIILAVVAGVLLILLLISSTGCSGDDAVDNPTATNTPVTPLTSLQNTVAGLESRVTYLEDNPSVSQSSITSIQSQITSLQSQIDALGQVLGELQLSGGASFDSSGLEADIDALNTQMATLTYNISVLEGSINSSTTTDLSDIEESLALLQLQINAYVDYLMELAAQVNELQPGATATPTPTTTPSIIYTPTKPSAINPQSGAINIPNGSVLFQWNDCNAAGYEFYFGTNTNSLELIDTLDFDALSFLWVAPDANTYYFWRIVALGTESDCSSTWWFKTSP